MINFKSSKAIVFAPDDLAPDQALARTTHMAISAHQDDIEIMAMDGILRCFQRDDQWFTGVVVTNGAGSPRSGLYERYTDEAMQTVRIKEQKKAAVVGEYAAQVLLGYSSGTVKDRSNQEVTADLVTLLKTATPQVVYTHNLADKHPTHVGVAIKVIEAVRSLSAAERPQHLYGCEVWRDLDWMPDNDKTAFNLSEQEGIQSALLGLFDSQISGGKRYDLATMGRRRAHATYFASHGTDVTTGLSYAMDLTPLIEDPTRDIANYVQSFIDRFAADVRKMITGGS
jgi:LmbE family N-acetylglucosaminyl deacetylase